MRQAAFLCVSRVLTCQNESPACSFSCVGFTRLNEIFSDKSKAAEKNTTGADEVTMHLNGFFGVLLKTINDYGGDCIKSLFCMLSMTII